MKCPECGQEMQKGIVEAKNARDLFNTSTLVWWRGVDENGKPKKRPIVDLPTVTEGWYCYDCMKVYAAFLQKHL